MKRGITLALLLGICIGLSSKARADDYYWVGGGGNWNDLTHWVNANGVMYTELPGQEDNVFFNGNSFTQPAPGNEVTLPIGNAYCKNFTWTNISSSEAPELIFPINSTLNIYGTFSLDSDVEVKYSSVSSAFIKMLGSNVNPAPGVFAAGNKLPNIEFNAVDGEWGFTGDVEVEGTLLVTAGELGNGAGNIRRNVVVNEFIIAGGNTNVDLSRMDIIAQSRFQMTAAGSISGASGGNVSTISTPLFQVSATGSFTFGQLTITGTNGLLDATGRSLTFDDDVILAATGTNTILGSHTYNGDLILNAPGSTVLLEAGSTQTFDSNQGILAPVTSCSDYITLRSTISGSAATIAKDPQNAGDVVSLSFFNIQDVHIDNGGAESFIATNSSDLGNTDGWDIIEPGAETLFWIGGSGNWSDGNHWSATSGGTALGCVPTAADDVVFDLNSFSDNNQIVTVDLASVYFHSMTWTDHDFPNNDSPTLAISSGSINVGGSLTLHPRMQLDIADPDNTFFNFISGHGGNTIAAEDISNDGFDLGNITFDGTGAWSLVGILNAGGNIEFKKGAFDTGAGNHSLFAKQIIIDGTGAIDFNDSQILVETFSLRSAGAFDADISSIYVTQLFEALPAGANFYQVFMEGMTTEVRGSGIVFEDLQFSSMKQVTVFGSHTYNNLLQFNEPGMIVEFEAGTIQKVFNLESLGVSCGGGITIRSTVSGSPITFEALPGSGNIEISNILLQDNVADPAGQAITFSAFFSQNLGNNSGWLFPAGSQASSKKYYWIGGSGNWTDGSHWSESPGGTAAGCIPTSIDDVEFDDMSFPDGGGTVTLNAAEQLCRNMLWTDMVKGKPSMSLPAGNSLSIYGSLRLASTSLMSLNLGGGNAAALWFKAQAPSTSNTIVLSGHDIPNLNFDGTGGWALTNTSSLTATSAINLINGHLNTAAALITADEFVVSGPNAVLTLGSSVLNIAEHFEITAISALNAGTSSLRTNNLSSSVSGLSFYEVRMVNQGVSPFADIDTEINADGLIFENMLFLGGTGQNLVHGSHTFNGTLQFEIGLAIAFFYFDAGSVQTLGPDGNLLSTGVLERPAIIQPTSEGTATFFKSSGAVCLSYVNMTDIIAEGGAVFGLVQSSTFGLSAGWVLSMLENCTAFLALPVECADFQAAANATNEVELYWITAQEVNNKGFAVQRSTDGRRFETIAWIEGAGTTTEAQKYTYTDRRTQGLSTVYYRLLQEDFDGAQSYACEVQAVSLRGQTRGPLTLAPNPAGETIRLSWFAGKNGSAIFRLFDQRGSLVLEREWSALEGQNQQELPLTGLPRGIYELQMLGTNGQLGSARLVKQ